ncbi:MAG: hypothetical protein NVS3B12_31750 [Acidimicrobiales bacterium]
MIDPWAFSLHPVVWLVCGGLLLAGWRVASDDDGGATRRRRARAGLAVGGLAAVTTWPVGDLARHSSFSVLMAAHLVLVLGVAPNVLLGLSPHTVQRATRHRVVDGVVRVAGIPLIAGLTSTVALVALHLPAVVDAAETSAVIGGLVTAGVVLAGTVLWVPVLGLVPGARRLGPGGRIGYLVVVSIIPNVPGSFLTFAGEPVYGSLVPGAVRLGIDPLIDTQIAGVLAKIGAALVLWGVATVIFFRAIEDERRGIDPAPLAWSEVEREFERTDRRRRRLEARSTPGSQSRAGE